jgi:mono/diheme cytochrome c family protein
LKDLRIAAGVVGLAAAVLSIAAWKPDPAGSTSRQDGLDLFLRKGCASCHNGPQTTARVPVAPSLANVADWAGERKPGYSAAEYVHESILNPPAFISPEFAQTGPVAMPSLNLTDAEIEALVTYLLDPQPSSP